MSKIFAFNMMTLDGFFEGPGPGSDISWHNVDDEFNDFAVEQLNEIGTIMFGRVTYEGMASYWPTPEAIANDPIVAQQMNDWPKIVISNTLDKADWNNTRLIKGGDVARELGKLKAQPGKDIAIFGSAKLVDSLMKMGLVDEHRVMVNPVVLGQGTPLFKSTPNKQDLKLVRTRTFKNGNVLLVYQQGK